MARSDEGSQLVEMCLSLLVLVALLMGTMEFSMAFLAYNEVTDAAREAARWAMVRGSTCYTNTPALSSCQTGGVTTDQVQTYVRSMNLPLLVSSNIGVTTTWLTAATTSGTGSTLSTTTWSACTPAGASACKIPGNQVQVQVSYSLPLMVKFWNTATNKFAPTRSTWSVSSTATMVIAQ